MINYLMTAIEKNHKHHSIESIQSIKIVLPNEYEDWEIEEGITVHPRVDCNTVLVNRAEFTNDGIYAIKYAHCHQQKRRDNVCVTVYCL